MSLTRNQIIIIGVGALIFLVLFLIVTGNFPGLQKGKERANLELWALYDNQESYRLSIERFSKIYPNVTVSVKEFRNEETYERELFRSFAAGGGPDIFMVHNASLDKSINFITPAYQDRFSLLRLRQLFPDTVERDFSRRGFVYALPTSIDTLVLIYNRNILSQAGVVFPPDTWEEFRETVENITRLDENGNITRAGAAIGTSENIPASADILSALMMQLDIRMRSAREATFANLGGVNALNFYTQFSDPAKTVYTWNSQMTNAVELFAQEKVGMIIDYGRRVPEIRARNPFINLGIHRFPRQSEDNPTAYASYWGYTVNRHSRHRSMAWEFVIFLTTDWGAAADYLNTTLKPPATRQLIQAVLNQSEFDALARQALIVNSWNQGDNIRVEKTLKKAITEAVNRGKTPLEALRTAQFEITQILREY